MRGTTSISQLCNGQVVFLVLMMIFQVVKGHHRHKLLVLFHDHHFVIALLRKLLIFLGCYGITITNLIELVVTFR